MNYVSKVLKIEASLFTEVNITLPYTFLLVKTALLDKKTIFTIKPNFASREKCFKKICFYFFVAPKYNGLQRCAFHNKENCDHFSLLCLTHFKLIFH